MPCILPGLPRSCSCSGSTSSNALAYTTTISRTASKQLPQFDICQRKQTALIRALCCRLLPPLKSPVMAALPTAADPYQTPTAPPLPHAAPLLLLLVPLHRTRCRLLLLVMALPLLLKTPERSGHRDRQLLMLLLLVLLMLLLHPDWSAVTGLAPRPHRHPK